jgi:uncharacterized membrane protein YhaH (DUF805 family)
MARSRERGENVGDEQENVPVPVDQPAWAAAGQVEAPSGASITTPGVPPADISVRGGQVQGAIGRGQQRFHIEDGTVTFSAEVLSPEGRRKQLPWLVALLVMLVPFLGAVWYAASRGPEELSDAWVITFLITVVGVFVTSIGLMIRSVAIRKRHVLTHTATFPVSAVSEARLAFDWNWGCILSILLSVIVGMIVMLARGKRVVWITAPLEPERGAKKHRYRFVARSTADALALVNLLAS